MEFSVVERPRGSGNVPSELLNAIIATKGTQNAVQLTLDQKTDFINWQGTIRAHLRKENVRLRARYNKVTRKVTCWAEDFDQERVASELTDAQLGVKNGSDDDEEEIAE